jgi:2,3-dihydroxyphenylpropionate 1,2-dioxygenase
MSSIVLGVGASHSTLMNTHWDRVVHRERAERFRDALGAARDALAAAEPDVVIIVGSNHFRGLWLDLVPAFTIGVGEVIASGESGTPKGPQKVDPELAGHLAERLVADGIDVAFSARLQIDHGQSHAIQWVLGGLDLPIVPLVVNVFAAPLPTLARCAQVGAALRRAVASLPGGRRAVVLGSGGLSHRLPWPERWQDPHGDDEAFMVEAWLEGRGDWSRFDPRRREIILAAESCISPEFDREFLAALEAGGLAAYTDWTTERLGERAGNGGQEIRTWLTMAAAVGFAPGRTLAYEELTEWLTGMAAAVIDPTVEAGTTAGAADKAAIREAGA